VSHSIPFSPDFLGPSQCHIPKQSLKAQVIKYVLVSEHYKHEMNQTDVLYADFTIGFVQLHLT
jgi:hypothetical protein